MKRDAWLRLLEQAVGDIESWEAAWPAVGLAPADAAATEAVDEMCRRLTANNYPFFHPRYAGQMLAPPHPVAWVAYATAMLINPNNHALDGGPATAEMEREVVAELAELLGVRPHLGHLTSGGTMANLEALWVAREETGGAAIAVCDNAHYTHARVASVLGVPVVSIPQTAGGRMDLDALDRALASGDVGTVVATLGTTGLGTVDPVAEIAAIAERHGARLHVDAAYGGFHALLTRRDPALVSPEPFDALRHADSVVVDPHKRGLQPYGCGCVLFRDPAVGRHYDHESPYTYFTSDELHFGEITLECSRPGASAAALWATMRAVPLVAESGLGAMLAAGRRAALHWFDLLGRSELLVPLLSPDLDIVCFAPKPNERRTTASAISRAADAVFAHGMTTGPDTFYLAKMRVPRFIANSALPGLEWDTDEVTVLRSVLMKPEHEGEVDALHALVEEAAAPR